MEHVKRARGGRVPNWNVLKQELRRPERPPRNSHPRERTGLLPSKLRSLPAHLLYYSNWLAAATQGPSFCAWSLAVEEQFYLAFGLLMCFARRRLVVGAALGVLITKAVVCALLGNIDADSALWRVVLSYQEPILLGVLLAFALNRRQGYEFFARRLGPAWAPACLGAATAVRRAGGQAGPRRRPEKPNTWDRTSPRLHSRH